MGNPRRLTFSFYKTMNRGWFKLYMPHRTIIGIHNRTKYVCLQESDFRQIRVPGLLNANGVLIPPACGSFFCARRKTASRIKEVIPVRVGHGGTR